MKINFKELNVSESISWNTVKKVDVRESFANLIYTNINGIRALSLAHKIFESDGEIEIDNEDKQIILDVTNNLCTPLFIEAINKAFKDEDNKE